MIETFASEPDPDIRLKRARMRAWRRGMREMDLILGGFIDEHGKSLCAERLNDFENLLAKRDQDLYAWISGRQAFPLTDLTESEKTLLEEIAVSWRKIS